MSRPLHPLVSSPSPAAVVEDYPLAHPVADVTIRIGESVIQRGLDALFPVRRPDCVFTLRGRIRGTVHDLLRVDYSLVISDARIRLREGRMGFAFKVGVSLSVRPALLPWLPLRVPEGLLEQRFEVGLDPVADPTGIRFRVVDTDIPIEIPLYWGEEIHRITLTHLNVGDFFRDLTIPIPLPRHESRGFAGKLLSVRTHPRLRVGDGHLEVAVGVDVAADGALTLPPRHDVAELDRDRVASLVKKWGGKLWGRLFGSEPPDSHPPRR